MAITLSKTELKGKMLAYFRRVENLGEELIVTSRGRPVAKVVPIRRQPCLESLFGDARRLLRDRGVRYDDEQLTEPLSTDVWDDLMGDDADRGS